MNEVLDHAREVVARILRAARPLAFIVVPLTIAHALFTRTPEPSPLPPLVRAISESRIPRYRLPREDDIVWASQATSEFRDDKFVFCPLVAPEHLMRASPLFRALQDAGYMN